MGGVEEIMGRVCELRFPKGWDPRQKKDGFYMEEILKAQMDILIKNIKNDWDFTILITGSGEVRVGKSLLAMQIAAYWVDQMKEVHGQDLPFSVEENFVFEGAKLIERGNKLGQEYKFAPLIFDEAGADLEGRKSMQSSTQAVLDYFRECGQYNMLNIIVLPEYFDLPKGIALSRSIFLVNVTYNADSEGVFQRGFFNFYSRRNKKHLYLKGKKELDYFAYPYDFRGRFLLFYPINEKMYREQKQKALSARETKKRNKFQMQRDASWYLLNREYKLTQPMIGQRMEQLTGIFVAKQTVSDAIIKYGVDEKVR